MTDKVTRAKAAAAVKAQRKAAAGLSRTIKLRVYPLPDQAKRINHSISVVRHVWNTIWLPMLHAVEQARRDHAKANTAVEPRHPMMTPAHVMPHAVVAAIPPSARPYRWSHTLWWPPYHRRPNDPRMSHHTAVTGMPLPAEPSAREPHTAVAAIPAAAEPSARESHTAVEPYRPCGEPAHVMPTLRWNHATP
jgi:Helix-turn-helix domain